MWVVYKVISEPEYSWSVAIHEYLKKKKVFHCLFINFIYSEVENTCLLNKTC